MATPVPLNNVIDRSLNYGRHVICRFLAAATDGAEQVVLDLGAGRGGDLLLARTCNPSAALHAIEIYPEYQNQLREMDITVHPMNIERDAFPFADESVNIIIANQILEHVKEVFWIFHEATRVLRVGGSLILGVPNLASLHNRMLLLFGRQPTCIQNSSAHVRGYTKSDLTRFVDACFPNGYLLKDFGGSNFYPFPPFAAKPLAKLFPTMAWGIFLMLRKERRYTREFIEYPAARELETNFFVGR
jgi:SAM-dependent methyltransferase